MIYAICELNGAILKVFKNGWIEKWTTKQGRHIIKPRWIQLKGYVFTRKNGYKQHRTSINEKLYVTSRIIYYAFYNDFDINYIHYNITIDHIDINSLNNCLYNLRIATAYEQNLNKHTKNGTHTQK